MIILFHSSFKKAYHKQTEGVRTRFDARLRIFKADPFHLSLNNHILRGRWRGYRSINITGDIRAVFKQKDDRAIFVDIDTHHNLYGT